MMNEVYENCRVCGGDRNYKLDDKAVEINGVISLFCSDICRSAMQKFLVNCFNQGCNKLLFKREAVRIPLRPGSFILCDAFACSDRCEEILKEETHFGTMLAELDCFHCRKPFEAKTSWQKFCSASCRSMNH